MIYCVEDDKSIRELVVYTLKQSGFEAQGFEEASCLFAALAKEQPQLILLDIMLPDIDGLEILRRLKNNSVYSSVPVIMLTARSSEYDKVMGLDCGADDYLAKPFGIMELMSRIKAVLRRAEVVKGGEVYTFGGLQLSDKAHRVTLNGREIKLTLKEFALLRLLLQNEGRVLTREILLTSIWGYDFDGETRTVDVHIRTLREKIGTENDFIETVWGIGYRIGGAK